MKQARQGDLYIKRVTEIPKLKKSTDNILLYGEVTNHSHRIQNGEVFKEGDIMFVNSNEKTVLVHEDHAPIYFKTGKFAVIRQREYSSNNMQKVVVD